MKTMIKFSISVAFLLLCTLPTIYSAPAYPFPVKVAQPNGDTITIRLYGDEYFHYTTTENGSVIMQDTDGYYKYAIINESNTLTPSTTNVSSFSLKGSQSDFINANSSLFNEKIRKPASTRIINEKLKRVVQNYDHSELRSFGDLKGVKSVKGSPKALVILANFDDKSFTTQKPQRAFYSLLNMKNYSENEAIGSAKDFYLANSQHTFSPEFVVTNVVTLPKPMAYYGKNGSNGALDVNAGQMIIDACHAADQQENVNFSEFDNDNDGIIDYLFVFYAGHNEAELGNSDAVWSHAASIYDQKIVVDGDTIAGYGCASELKGRIGRKMAPVGIFLHEFSHLLGLPDLYDSDLKLNGDGIGEDIGYGVGRWCTMGFGLYAPYTEGITFGSGTTPPYFGAMERYVLGWISPIVLNPDAAYGPWPVNVISTPKTGVLRPLPTSNESYVLVTPTRDEFFSFEVRKKEDPAMGAWDAGLPGEGLLVYHVDMTKDKKLKVVINGVDTVASALELWSAGLTNIIENHQCMDMLRANNDFYFPSGNPYPGTTKVTTISDNTTPGFFTWNKEPTKVKVSNINRNADGSISFSIQSEVFTTIEESSVDLPIAYAVGKQLYFNNINGNTHMEIYDISGNKIFQKTIGSGFSYNLPYSGHFIVKMVVNNKTFISKILAQ